MKRSFLDKSPSNPFYDQSLGHQSGWKKPRHGDENIPVGQSYSLTGLPERGHVPILGAPFQEANSTFQSPLLASPICIKKRSLKSAIYKHKDIKASIYGGDSFRIDAARRKSATKPSGRLSFTKAAAVRRQSGSHRMQDKTISANLFDFVPPLDFSLDDCMDQIADPLFDDSTLIKADCRTDNHLPVIAMDLDYIPPHAVPASTSTPFPADDHLKPKLTHRMRKRSSIPFKTPVVEEDVLAPGTIHTLQDKTRKAKRELDRFAEKKRLDQDIDGNLQGMFAEKCDLRSSI